MHCVYTYRVFSRSRSLRSYKRTHFLLVACAVCTAVCCCVDALFSVLCVRACVCVLFTSFFTSFVTVRSVVVLCAACLLLLHTAKHSYYSILLSSLTNTHTRVYRHYTARHTHTNTRSCLKSGSGPVSESFGVVQSHSESSRVHRSRPKSIGVVQSPSESSRVHRSRPEMESVGVNRSRFGAMCL